MYNYILYNALAKKYYSYKITEDNRKQHFAHSKIKDATTFEKIEHAEKHLEGLKELIETTTVSLLRKHYGNNELNKELLLDSFQIIEMSIEHKRPQSVYVR